MAKLGYKIQKYRLTAFFKMSLYRYYRQDKGNFTTTIQSITNEKKYNIIVLPFSRVGISCCLICKHKNTGIVTVPAKPLVTHFL